MAKKTTDWGKISKDKQLLEKAEALVKLGAQAKGALPQEICDELNALTGNGWKAAKYQEFCEAYDWPWTVQEIVYALFHGGEYPDKTEYEIHAWSIENSTESDWDVITFFHMCTYQHEPEKTSTFDQVNVKPLNDELLSAFAGWEIEDDWEEYNFCTFCCTNKENYGLEKALKIYNGYDHRMLHCRLYNFTEQEKETVLDLLKKYYNHICTDYDMEKAVKQSKSNDTGFDADDMSAIMQLLSAYDEPQVINRDYLEQNWEVSSYNEDTDEQLDFYIDEQNNHTGDTAYLFSHEDGELHLLQIANIIARSNDAAAYDKLLEEDDVLCRLEDEHGADYGAEFITNNDCYLVCFKEVEG